MVSVIFLEPEKNESLERIRKIADRIIRKMLEAKIVKEEDFGSMCVKFNKETNRFENNEIHLTLFRSFGIPEDEYFIELMDTLKFEPLKLDLDFLDISTRFQYDETKFYSPLTRIKLDSKPE